MTIFTRSRPLVWGELDVPLLGITKDLAGQPVVPAAGFCVLTDPERLWFIANHREPATLHPRARPGIFLAELWRYDVAELFLTHPVGSRYLEINLAPNGAWWTCEFTAPRERTDEAEIAMPEVATFSELAADGSWIAAMAIPLDLLKARLDFGELTRMNVTMILGSPDQRFLSAADLGDGEPDFHQPAKFPRVDFKAIED